MNTHDFLNLVGQSTAVALITIECRIFVMALTKVHSAPTVDKFVTQLMYRYLWNSLLCSDLRKLYAKVGCHTYKLMGIFTTLALMTVAPVVPHDFALFAVCAMVGFVVSVAHYLYFKNDQRIVAINKLHAYFDKNTEENDALCK